LHAEGLAAAVLVIGQGLADAAADVEHPHIARHVAEGGGLLAAQPRQETAPFLFGAEAFDVETAARIIARIELAEILRTELRRNVPMATGRAAMQVEQIGIAVTVV